MACSIAMFNCHNPEVLPGSDSRGSGAEGLTQPGCLIMPSRRSHSQTTWVIARHHKWIPLVVRLQLQFKWTVIQGSSISFSASADHECSLAHVRELLVSLCLLMLLIESHAYVWDFLCNDRSAILQKES